MQQVLKWLNDLTLLSKKDSVRTKQSNEIWCPVRRKWLVSAPEEWVRLLLIHYLIEDHKAPKGRLAIEKKTGTGSAKRYDLTLANEYGNPFLLIECKAPEVNFNPYHLYQVVEYNQSLNAQFIMWTNGHSAWIFDVKKDVFLDEIQECLDLYS